MSVNSGRLSHFMIMNYKLFVFICLCALCKHSKFRLNYNDLMRYLFGKVVTVEGIMGEMGLEYGYCVETVANLGFDSTEH